MRETLVFLTHLDHEDTHMIMTSKLQKQVQKKKKSKTIFVQFIVKSIEFFPIRNYKIDGSEWDRDKLNTL